MSHPVYIRDDFPGSSLSGSWGVLLTGANPVTALSGGYLTVTCGNPDYLREVVILSGSAIANKRVRAEVLISDRTNQFALLWAQARSDDHLTGHGVTLGYAHGLSPAVRLTRRVGATSGSSPTSTVFSLANPTAVLTDQTTYIYQVDVYSSGGANRRYLFQIQDVNGNYVAGSSGDSGWVSNSNTDSGDYSIGLSSALSGRWNWVEVQDLEGPNVVSHPSNLTVNNGGSGTFTAAAQTGDRGSGSITYQWEQSFSSGATWFNVTGGFADTTPSYSTGPKYLPDNQTYFRCKITDSGNGKVNYSDAAILTVLDTSGPVIGVPYTSTSGKTVYVPWSQSVTGSTSTGTWRVTKGNSNTVVPIASVSHSGSVTTLSLSGRIYLNETNVKLDFYGGADAVENLSGVDADAQTGITVTNDATCQFALAIADPYDSVGVFRGRGFDIIRAPLTRQGTLTESITYAINAPAGVSGNITQPGTSSLGYITFYAGSGAALATGGVTVTVSGSDGYEWRAQNLTLYVNDYGAKENEFQLAFGGSSTCQYFEEHGVINFPATPLTGGALSWTWTHVTQDHGAFGVGGSTVHQWATGAVEGYSHKLHVWGVRNGARGVVYTNTWANVAPSNEPWSTMIGDIRGTLKYWLENYEVVFSCGQTYRYDQTAQGAGVIIGVTGNVLTLSGTAGTVNQTSTGAVLITNWSGGKQVRDILSVTPNGSYYNFTVDSPFLRTPTGTFEITAAGFRNIIRNYNASGQALCKGYANAMSGSLGQEVINVPTDIWDWGRDWLQTDKIHLVSSGSLEHIRRITNLQPGSGNDRGFCSWLLRNATVSFMPATGSVPYGGTIAFGPNRTVDGYAAYNANHWTDGLLSGTWTLLTGGAFINSSGTIEGPTIDGQTVYVARFTLAYTGASGVGVLLIVDVPVRELSSFLTLFGTNIGGQPRVKA